MPDRDVALSFGPFTLLPGQRTLLDGERTVRLGSRALDILIALVDRAGEMVGKKELIAIVWPRNIVEEGALRVHVAALRKCLGDGQGGLRYIINVPGRGYSFVAPLMRSRIPAGPSRLTVRAEVADEIPLRLTHMVGREDVVVMLAAQLPARRLVTVVGPGGMGKTTVALAVADRTRIAYKHGAYFVDFAAVATPRSAVSAIATALGLSETIANVASGIAAFVHDRDILLVFDSCDYVSDEIVPLVEYLLKSAPKLHVLATSREPLHADGEWVHQLRALTVPPKGRVSHPAQALEYSAFELFIERATASLDTFELSMDNVQVISHLCQRLDGNPLAIELAAARVDIFGLHGLARQLDSHLLQLKQSRRTALPRHQTLGAMLDWSYLLLKPDAQRALDTLAILNGRFPLEAASELLQSIKELEATSASALNYIADLFVKSWLTSEATRDFVFYRLLELTRAYALTKLKGSGRHGAVAEAHARYCHILLGRAADAWTILNMNEWMQEYQWFIGDVRAALAWCFSPEGNISLGVTLTAAAIPMLTIFNPFDEPQAIERALNALAMLPGMHRDLEMQLNSALVFWMPQQTGVLGSAVEAAKDTALQLAERHGDVIQQADVLMGYALGAAFLGNYTQAVEQSERLNVTAKASGDPITIVIAERIGAQVQHYAGQHQKARLFAERVLRHPIPRGSLRTMSGGVDHAVSMRTTLSRILWLEGFADQAASLAQQTFERATKDGTLALCHTLCQAACPIALWRGETDLASAYIRNLAAEVANNGERGNWLPVVATIPWQLVKQAVEDPEHAVDLPASPVQLEHLITAHDRFATRAIVERITLSESWCRAEILRAFAENLLREKSIHAGVEAKGLMEKALSISRIQGALAWELRASTSLARITRDEGRVSDALKLLEPVYRRFTEGFETADLKSARALLEQLSTSDTTDHLRPNVGSLRS